MTGDDLAQILYVNNDFKPTWYTVGATPEMGFELGGELTQNQTIQQGSGWGDLNGDGKNCAAAPRASATSTAMAIGTSRAARGATKRAARRLGREYRALRSAPADSQTLRAARIA